MSLEFIPHFWTFDCPYPDLDCGQFDFHGTQIDALVIDGLHIGSQKNNG
jgi:hypothetical protein